MKDSSRDWETLVTDLTSPSWTWSGVDPLLPYSIRVIGRNQFGAGQPSRATHVDAQVVIPDLSFVIPVVREPSGILEGREPAELRWQLPRAYTLKNTLTPFTYEVQVRPVGADWSVLASGLKVPHCQLNQLRPDQDVIYLPLGADLDLRCSLTSQSLQEPVRFVWSFNFQPIPDDPS
ncbi:unnamed protein product [Dibothriocephalus latus]|uniref:Fibronectin type-III domain-containing protein n=1 Tax=Dibothriocephalus latus TaxID=60516 RepID=A0A3P7LQF8_DIBLA|nr:unnamed protein product [Dibothriocephalus latus]